MCNEGITILEFDVKLSQEDYKNLKLDQTIYKESDDAEYEQRKEEAKKSVVNDVRHILWGKYQKVEKINEYEYKVYDANWKELSCFRTSNKHTLIYSNGFREDYDPHDIPTKTYSNAVWETIEYLLIEKCDTDYIKIVPVESIINPVNDEQSYGEIYYEMDPLIINLK